jgi:membrane protease YdiL (CAAX protease family)
MKKESISEWLIKIACYTMIPLFLLILGILLSTTLFFGNIETDINNVSGIINILITFTLPMFFSLFIIPAFIYIKILGNSWKSCGMVFNKQKINIYFCIISVLVSILAILNFYDNPNIYDKAGIIISFIGVAFTEEFITRGLLLSILREKINFTFCIILNGFIFAFVYHSSSDFFGNLIIRFPLGMFLTLLAIKTKNIYPGIFFHFAFNIFVNSF